MYWVCGILLLCPIMMLQHHGLCVPSNVSHCLPQLSSYSHAKVSKGTCMQPLFLQSADKCAALISASPEMRQSDNLAMP